MWRWPQYTMALLTVLDAFGIALKHGQGDSTPRDVLVTLLSVVGQVYILHAGGFW